MLTLSKTIYTSDSKGKWHIQSCQATFTTVYVVSQERTWPDLPPISCLSYMLTQVATGWIVQVMSLRSVDMIPFSFCDMLVKSEV